MSDIFLRGLRYLMSRVLNATRLGREHSANLWIGTVLLGLLHGHEKSKLL